MKRVIILATTLFTLISCTSPAANKATGPGAMKASDLSVRITGYKKKDIFSTEYNAFIKGVYDEQDNAIFESSFWKQPARQLNLEPGSYLIKLSCQNGYFSGYPEMKVDLNADTQYEVFCAVEKGRNLLGMRVDAMVRGAIREL